MSDPQIGAEPPAETPDRNGQSRSVFDDVYGSWIGWITAQLYPYIGDVVDWVRDRTDEIVAASGSVDTAAAAIDQAATSIANFPALDQAPAVVDVLPFAADAQGGVVIGYRPDVGDVRLSKLTVGPAVPAADVLMVAVYGQSNARGPQATPALSTSQPYDHVMFTGGPVLVDPPDTLVPLVESGNESPVAMIANFYSETLAQLRGDDPAGQVILANSCARGSRGIDELGRDGVDDQDGLRNYLEAFLFSIRQAARGAHDLGQSLAVLSTVYIQGEAEAENGVTGDPYEDQLSLMASDVARDVHGITGQREAPFFLINQTARNTASGSVIPAAQLAAADGSDLVTIVCPIYHLPHADDDLHLSAVGSALLGCYFGRANAELTNLQPVKVTRMISATRRGAQIRVRYNVPYAPLVLDTVFVEAVADMGFVVTDDDVAQAITSVSLDGDFVVIDLAAAPTGVVTVRYALDHELTWSSDDDVAGGNLRDSAPETAVLDGITYNLYNAALHQALPVFNVGG